MSEPKKWAWAEKSTQNGLVRFLFGFGIEVEKSSIFSLILQNQISGESGRELAENREEKAREREIQNLNFSVKFGVKYIFHKKIYLKSRCLTGVAVVEWFWSSSPKSQNYWN